MLEHLKAAQLSPNQIHQITRRYGRSAPVVIQAHPYRLAREITGLSFQSADTLAQRLGRGKVSTERVRAGIQEIVRRATHAGHTSLPLPLILTRASTLLQVSRGVVEEQCLRGALEVGGEFFVERRGAETFLSTLELKRMEEGVAQALKDRTQLPSPPLVDNLDAVVRKAAQP